MNINIFEYVLYSYMDDHEENIDDIRELIQEFNSIKWEVIPQ